MITIHTSIFLAKLIGPYCLVATVGMALNQASYQRFLDDYLHNAALKYISGMLALIIGLLIVNTHNVWEGSWRVVITIFGWISLTKGIWIFWFPNQMGAVARAYHSNSMLLRVNLVLLFVLGSFLTVKGYF